MHFCDVVARVYGRLSKPRNTSLNWFIPAFVNSSVGSSPGTTGDEATMVWPLASKNFRKVERISAAFIPALSGGRAWAKPWRANSAIGRATRSREADDYKRRGPRIRRGREPEQRHLPQGKFLLPLRDAARQSGDPRPRTPCPTSPRNPPPLPTPLPTPRHRRRRG